MKGVENNSENNTVPLYKSMVHVHLVHAVQFGHPISQKDITEIEKI